LHHAAFVHLRVRSCYSLLESTVRFDELIGRCREQRMPAVAVTDRANLFGALEFSQSAAKAGIQPIIGCLLPVVEVEPQSGNGRPAAPAWLPMLVQSEVGYRNLLRLLSRAYLGSEITSAPELHLADLEEFADGLILFSGGPEGPVGKALLHGNRGRAEGLLRRLRDAFSGRLYVELLRHDLEAEDAIEPALIELAEELDLPLIATNDVHFTDAAQFEAQDVLLCIADGAQVGQENRRRATPEHRFKSAEEMLLLFADLPEATANTLVVARRCSFLVPAHEPILPAFSTAPGGDEAAELRAQAQSGLHERLAVHRPTMTAAAFEAFAAPYRERLDYELGVITQMKYEGYFLIVADFVRYAKSHGIPVGPGRGSGAGSVVAWALGITDLDPLRFGLLFERFLNPERVSMPDFDIDFCQDHRDEVIRYVRQRYGDDRVAAIITFGKLQARAVLRDVGRALGLPYGQVDRVAKLVPFNPAHPPTLEQALVLEPRLQEAAREDEQVAHTIEIAKRLEGLPRHASTHAAGVVIGDRPLDQLIPLYRDPRADMPVTQFNMKDVEKAGLVKFDFLGLTTLTMLALAERLVNERLHKEGRPPLELAKLPLDDPATFELLGRGETGGVFQLESGGMRDALRKLQPDCFVDIIAMNALYRPGPMDNIPRYINCKHGVEQPEYLHPMLEPILKETYGVIIYQEQVLQIARELAGYSLGGADLLRRAMGKKIKAEMDAQRETFIKGATERQIPPKLAGAVFEQVAKFASYGFVKAHATAYALLAYQTAWLKANHPVEFFAAAMTLDRANQDRLGVYRQEIARAGIPLLPPDVNHSHATFTVEATSAGSAIRYALAAIRGVGVQAVEALVAERAAGGPFTDLFDLSARTGGRVLNRRLLEALIRAGALDALHANRRSLLEGVDLAMRYGNAHAAQASSEQASLFGGLVEHAQLPKPALPAVEDYPLLERLQQEFETLGFYLSAHPLDGYRTSLAKLGVVSSEQLPACGGLRVKLAGVVLGKQERTTPRSRFAFVQLSDPGGSYEVTVFAELLGRARDRLEAGESLLIEGEVRVEGDTLRVLASAIERLDAVLANGGARAQTRIEVRLRDPAVAGQLGDLLGPHGDGGARVRLVLPLDAGQEVAIDLGDAHRLALARRIDLERRAGVIGVVDF
jgi:DNA polymerase-3 subunit alpha